MLFVVGFRRRIKAVCWNGINEVKAENVADPEIINSRDVIVQVRATRRESDLHPYNGYIATHRMTLKEAPRAYEKFKKKIANCVRGVYTVTRGGDN